MTTAWLGSCAVLAFLLISCGNDSSQGGGGKGGAGTGGAAGSGATGGAAGSATGGTDAGGLPGIGPIDLSESAASLAEAGPHVAVTKNGRVGVGWIGREASRNVIGYRLSDDLGKSWGDIQLIEPPTDFGCGDPTLAAHPDGDLWIGWGTVKRDAQGNRIEGHLYAASAAPGAKSFGPPIEITDPNEDMLYDQPRLHIRSDGRVLYSYMKYAKVGFESGIYVASSSDGKTFARSEVAGGSGQRNFAFLCSGPEAKRVWIKYQDFGSGIVLAWSDDGGATFPAANKTKVQADDESSVFGLSTPGCVASGDDVWVLYGINAGLTSPGENDIFDRIRLAHSKDAGSTIASRNDVHDSAAGGLYMFPEIAREAGGAVNIAYYAAKSVDDPQASFRTARSTDMVAFSPSLTIKSPLKLSPNRSSPAWLGDYVGLAWEGGHLFSAFTDNESGYGHISFWRSASE